MRRRLNREKALFAFAVLLLCWALVKWGIFLGTRRERLGPAVVPHVAIHTGDTNLADRLPGPPLSRYALGDDPFRLAQRRHPDPLPEPDPDPDGEIVVDGEDGREEKHGTRDRKDEEDRRVGTVRDEDQLDIVKPPKDERLVIEPLPHAELPLRLVGTVKAGRDDPTRRALIQDMGTGAVRDVRVGDLLPGHYKLGSIQDDSVIVIDARGRSYVLGGRHQRHYN